NGKRYSKYFDRLIDAKEWSRLFCPNEDSALKNIMAVSQLIELYKSHHLSSLAKSTQLVKGDRLKFLDGLAHYKVEQPTPDIINRYFAMKLNEAKSISKKRMNFNQEIKDLKALLNWYRDNYNYKFILPINKSLRNK